MQDTDSIRSHLIKKSKIRKERMPKNAKSETKTSSIASSAGYISTFILFVTTVLIYDVIVVSRILDDIDVDFQAIKTELTSSVHNQSEAVQIILDNLEEIQKHDETVNVVNFIGSTGVGKTFVSNIIKKHFNPSVYELSGLLKDNSQQEILKKISASRYSYNLIIIDDLTVQDVDKLLLLIKKIPQDLVALVICIFNIQETDSVLNYKINYDNVKKITDGFNVAEIPHAIAKFHEFSRDQARDWIVKQLVMKGIDMQFYPKIVQSVLEGQNVKFHGLKGLSSKLNLEL